MFPISFWRCSSSAGSCTSEVRREAREVCVPRWYDPGTGEFASVDPDVAGTDNRTSTPAMTP